MKFSVVVPLFNKQACIALTLQSALAQTFADLEVIVVDDGSSDQGPDIVKAIALADARVRLLQQSNSGVSAARNAGVAVAEGEWVAFLDADDYWHPDYLQQQLVTLAQFPMVDMAATQLRKVPDALDWNPMPWPSTEKPSTRSLIADLPTVWMQGIPFFTSSVVVRRQRLVELHPLFPMGESRGEDLDVWFRLAESGPIAHYGAPLSAYRTAGAQSLSSLHARPELPPFMLRMRERAISGVLPAQLSGSILRFIDLHKTTCAREEVMGGQRMSAFKWLWSARRVMLSKRWVTSLVMALLFSPALARRWKVWRYRRVAA